MGAEGDYGFSGKAVPGKESMHGLGNAVRPDGKAEVDGSIVVQIDVEGLHGRKIVAAPLVSGLFHNGVKIVGIGIDGLYFRKICAGKFLKNTGDMSCIAGERVMSNRG